MLDYEPLDLGISTVPHGGLETLHLVWHLAGAPEVAAELNRFGKKQGITILLIQMGKLRLKELIGVFLLYQGLSPK